MPKPSIVEVENPTVDHVCEKCGGTRFQVHERGTLRIGEAVTVVYDELAILCLRCLDVTTVPVTGVLDYKG